MKQQHKICFSVLTFLFSFYIIFNKEIIGVRFSLHSSRELSDNKSPWMSLIDYRQLCSGPRRRNMTGMVPFYKHERVKYGLRVGRIQPYGQFNNHIIALFTALDAAWTSNNLTVVVVSGWAENLLSIFFPDDQSWYQLSCELPIVRESSLHFNLVPLLYTSKELFDRNIDLLKEKTDWRVTHTRRVAFLHYLFSSLEGPPCRYLSKMEGYLQGRFQERKYIAVHVRNMDGNCTVFSHNQKEGQAEQCEMNASFIRSLVEPTGLYGKLPIVVLSDMQDQEKVRRIQNEISMSVVPEWDLEPTTTMLSDMVVGARSEIFIGNRASSMSRNIAILREAFGKHKSTNFVYIAKSKDGNWTSLIPEHPYSWAWYDN